MSHRLVQVTFSESEVSTLAELAEELKEMYGWKSWRISENGANIVFSAKDSGDGRVKEGYVGPSGSAYRLEGDPDDRFGEEDGWDEYDVNWDEDFDGRCDHVRGADEYGNTVMVHS